MMLFEGKGKKLRITRTVFGQELERLIETDLATGIRVLEVGPVEITKNTISSEAGILAKAIEILKAKGASDDTLAEVQAAHEDFAAQATPSRYRNVFFRGSKRMSRQNLTVFESDGALHLFDDLKAGDMINATVTRLPGGNGFRCLSVEKAKEQTPAPAQLV